ncbi:ankyrin repeat-containing domain protein [Aspergillus flavus]|uniref:Ankyrin repeat-containing domain protein n=1 Tax=Aspergillus flavus TaxID=5059 RepID=A0A5N6H375_ASPFL|nr:ankyrin repeat-containing domain protein [Aspergillus flavus]KAJ1716884.1 serine/threonine-protein kinase ripk4 [Aspergillus flavus]
MDSHQLFLHAAATGDIASMEQEYLKNKAVLTGKDSDNRTALHLAVLNGHLKAVERLLDYGIAWCPKDNQGQTALHLAAQLSSATIAETLLERGANCCTQDHDGKTPIFYAYQNYSPDVDPGSSLTAASSACEVIVPAALSPTERLLLNQFVKAALDTEVAARYLISRATGVQQDVETSLG